jgi:hypothetical protein
MSFCNRVAFPIVAAVSLAFLVACGSSSNKATPPPTGGFSNSNLSGTYVFSTEGSDPNSGETMTIVGAFTACGCSGGTISAGTFDYFDPSVGMQTGNAITSGSYNVGVDGRGTVTLANGSSFGTVQLDFVLNSTSGGTVSEYNKSLGGGSGTLELQSSVTLGSNYAFSVSGENLANTEVPYAYAMAGAFSLGSGGALINTSYDATLEDLENGAITTTANSSFSASSSLSVGTGVTPGQATFTDASSGTTFTFDVFAISSNDLKLFETDGVSSASGDAFPQATSLPSGTLAFTMNGLDATLNPLSLGGLLTFSGTSITSGIEDFNDNGSANTDSSVGGSFNNPITDGRASLQLTAFYNGAAGGQNSSLVTFAAYPTSNGTLLLEVDGAGVSAGNALVQTNTSLAASQGYGVNVSATNISGESTGSGLYEEDDIAEFTSTSSGFTGLVDVNDGGQTTNTSNPPLFDGSYSSLSTGRYQFAANSNAAFNGISGVVYTVDGSTLLFLEGDTFQVGTGMLQVQNASGSDAQVSHHVAVFRQLATKHAMKRQQK